jgi:MFS family permease
VLGPLTIGRFFDTIGRKQMIAATYLGSGAMLAVTAVLFDHHVLTATTQTIAWCVIFFFASAGASSAYRRARSWRATPRGQAVLCARRPQSSVSRCPARVSSVSSLRATATPS